MKKLINHTILKIPFELNEEHELDEYGMPIFIEIYDNNTPKCTIHTFKLRRKIVDINYNKHLLVLLDFLCLSSFKKQEFQEIRNQLELLIINHSDLISDKKGVMELQIPTNDLNFINNYLNSKGILTKYGVKKLLGKEFEKPEFSMTISVGIFLKEEFNFNVVNFNRSLKAMRKICDTNTCSDNVLLLIDYVIIDNIKQDLELKQKIKITLENQLSNKAFKNIQITINLSKSESKALHYFDLRLSDSLDE